MSLVKEIPANGKSLRIEEAVAEAVAELIPEAVTEVVTVVKAEVVEPVFATVVIPEIKPEPVISVERRIEKVEELKITIRKYQQLQDARKGLNNFSLGSDGNTATLTLKDADGTPYSISNPVVVEAALIHIRQILTEKIQDTEKEINFSL